MRMFRNMTTVVATMVTVMTLMVVQETNAARILMAVPIGTKSHGNFYMPLAENLARRNHTVTYISGYKKSSSHPNIREVVVPDVNIFEKMPSLFTTDRFTAIGAIYDDMKTVCIKALAYEEVQRLNDEKFDLVILYAALTECFLSFAHKLKVPFMYINPNKLLGAYAAAAGSPAFPSLDATYMLDLEYPLTFTGRMLSTLHNIMDVMVNELIFLPSLDNECRARKLCPEDMPYLGDLRYNGSLLITNSVRTMEKPTLPYTPTVVHAGGIHCRPAKPLPEDLQQWIAGAGEPGFILFSLGTLIKSADMPEKYLKVLADVLGSLQQRVLWKWDKETMEGLPHNVRLAKWIPQQDVLGHPQLRLFITHGGLFSTQEATYHGVPILGMPVGLDQHYNMRKVQKEGWGHVLYWEDLTHDNLRDHILQLISDKRILEEVQQRSRLMRDQPMSPKDWASYWVEYVLKHQGASHLRSPAGHMPWYQLYNADVWAVLVVTTTVTTILTSWLSFRILRALLRCCCASRKTKKE
ncbi:UDP-glycosyltransferase UGT5-like isoform X1 [Portunus trituberculatus]|uniref:UDP-glycosyltransferase UGT5-like isoform X1 n=2 Tax=Portunus trituberculatus TaxID=210409 RepID=UPI001E1CF9C5|nr:UDP-glycosyltransferase UGT5-like isoform X1 [Portunus trituberculatus]